jgi:rod shape-determining protein MreD
MGPVVLVLLAMLAAAVPDLVPTSLGIANHAPDLFAALAIFLALRADGYGAVPWAILLGLAKDASSLDPAGCHAFTLGVVAFVVSRPRSAPAATGAARALAVAGATLLAHVVGVLRMIPVAPEGLGLSSLAGGVAVAFWTGLFTWPLLSLLERTRVLDALVGRTRDASA